MKQHAPATLRNREAILAVLRKELPVTKAGDAAREGARVLEIAAGTGEHAVFFAQNLPNWRWLPSDQAPEALLSIEEHRAEAGLPNLEAAVLIDVSQPDWPIEAVDAIVCINMVHISPWEATQGLFAGAARILGGKGLPLILYGPYLEQGVETAPSNLSFDESLRARNPAWGIRDIAAVDALAASHGFARSARHAMPANNLTLVYRVI